MDGELRCRPRQATCPPGQSSASTPTARKGKTKELAICISRDLLDLSLVACEQDSASLAKFETKTKNTSRCSGRPRPADACPRHGEGVSHRGDAQTGRVESDKDAQSVGGSPSVRKPASTTTGADRRWPQRYTVIHSARITGSPVTLR